MGKEFTQIQYKKLYEIATRTPTVLPFINDTPKKKDLRRKKATGNGWDAFSFYAKTYYPHAITKPFCDDHRDAFNYLEGNIAGITAMTAFRGFAKTVLFGCIYSLWKITKKEIDYIMNVAADEDLAAERSLFMLNQCTNNKRLLTDYPFMQAMDTDEYNFYLKNKTRIRARSIRQALAGTWNPKTAKRVGLFVCDDIDKEENIGNQSIGKRRMEKITGELFGALDPSIKARGIWLGNLVHPNYAICQFKKLLIGEIKANEPNSDPENRQHLISGKKILLEYPVEKKDGTSRWEEQYPTDSLPELKTTYGPTGYQRWMLGIDVIDGNIFKNEWFAEWQNLPPMKRMIMRADPSWGQKGCYKSIEVIGFPLSKNDDHFYMEICWLRQTSNNIFFKVYYDTYRKMSVKYGSRFRAWMETSYGQQRILNDFDRWCKDNKLPIISYHIKHDNVKSNKNLDIESIDIEIESGKLLLPPGQDTPTLKSQFLTYPQGYIDGPDNTARLLKLFPEFSIGKSRIRVRSSKGY